MATATRYGQLVETSNFRLRGDVSVSKSTASKDKIGGIFPIEAFDTPSQERQINQEDRVEEAMGIGVNVELGGYLIRVSQSEITAPDPNIGSGVVIV